MPVDRCSLRFDVSHDLFAAADDDSTARRRSRLLMNQDIYPARDRAQLTEVLILADNFHLHHRIDHHSASAPGDRHYVVGRLNVEYNPRGNQILLRNERVVYAARDVRRENAERACTGSVCRENAREPKDDKIGLFCQDLAVGNWSRWRAHFNMLSILLRAATNG